MKAHIFLQNIVMLTRIPICVFEKNGTLMEQYEVMHHEPVELEKSITEEVKDELKEHDFVFREYEGLLPVGLCGCRGKEYNYVLGPFAYGTMDTKEIQTYMRRNKMQSFAECQLRICLVSAGMILNEFTDEEYTLNKLEQHIKNRNSSDREEEDQAEWILVNEELRQIDTFQENHTYMEEREIYRLIEQGKPDELEENWELLLPPHPVILNEINKNEEYMAVIGISLATRAAIEGGLTSREGFLMNDMYLKRLASCKNLSEIQNLLKSAHLYCASRVQKMQRTKGTNKYVEECKKIIISNRVKSLDLQEIADEVGISKEYMSKLFKQHEGVPVIEYILNIKMEAACNMLRYSDRKVNEIADYLSFQSLSYFSRLFKKKIGMPPQEYRKRMNSLNY